MKLKSAKFLWLLLIVLSANSCNKKYGSLQVRFHHFSANAPQLTWVYAGKDSVAKTAYLQSSNYVTASLENVSFIAYANNQALVSVSNPNWQENGRYSVFVCDTLGKINKVLVSDAHDAVPPGKALIRFLHLVPDTIGIVLLANGNDLFSSKKFRFALGNYAHGISSFEALEPGSYNFVFRTVIDSLATDYSASISTNIEGGKIYNLIATGLPNAPTDLAMKLEAVPFKE